MAAHSKCETGDQYVISAVSFLFNRTRQHSRVYFMVRDRQTRGMWYTPKRSKFFGVSTYSPTPVIIIIIHKFITRTKVGAEALNQRRGTCID
jgi:hypothetical protein